MASYRKKKLASSRKRVAERRAWRHIRISSVQSGSEVTGLGGLLANAVGGVFRRGAARSA